MTSQRELDGRRFSASAGARAPRLGRTVFVGRETERAALDRAWDAPGTRISLVVVSGPAGHGKTALATDLVGRIRPTVLLEAVGEPDEGTLAFGILAQLLSDVPLASVPGLAAAVAGGGGDPLVVGSDLVRLVEELGQDELMIVVDDAQWADAPSLRALAFALRRLRVPRALAVLCCRDDGVGTLTPGLRRLLEERAEWVSTSDFGPDDVAGLVMALGRGRLSRQALDRIVEHGGGSPLHSRALITELTTAQLEGDFSRPLPAPRTFAELVRTRLSFCREPTASVVSALAVLGDGTRLPLLSAVSGLADPAPALDEAAAAGLVETPHTPDALRLAHPLVRSAVYYALPLSTRVRLHHRASAALAAGDAVASLRHRVAAATGPDSELAADLAQRASVDAGRGAWAAAAHGLRDAVDLCPPSSAAVADYLVEMVEYLVLAGDAGPGAEAAAQLEAQPADPVRDYCLARLRALTGDLPGAAELARAAWSDLGDDGVAARPLFAARVSSELARTALLSGRATESLGWVERTWGLAPPDHPACADSLGTRMLALGTLGRTAEALAMVPDLPDVVDRPTPAELDALIGRGLLRLWNADLDAARSDLETVVRTTLVQGPVFFALGASAYLADAHYRRGDWAAAVTVAETALAVALDIDHVRSLPILHAAAAMPRAARGELEVAAEHVAEAVRTAALVGDLPSRLAAAVAAGRLGDARRSPDDVLSALDPLSALRDLDGVREPGLQPWQCLYASALADVGRADDADAVLAEAGPLARDRGHPVQQLAVERARAHVLVARGNLEAALDLLVAAGALRAATIGRPFGRACFDLLHGIVLRRLGDPSAAAKVLAPAQRTFAALGAAPWTTDADDELARCGVGARPEPAGGARPLTASEEQIARLVGEGLSNRAIAEHLVVSVKTVEYHLSNIYAKRGVRSRVQLAVLRRDQGRRPSETPAT